MALLIYDPDGLNPYGMEVARLLEGLDVTLITAAGSGRNFDTVHALQLLPSNRRSPKLCQAVRFLRALMHTLGNLLRGVPVVIVWTRNNIDCIFFLISAAFGAKLAFVVHNPVPRDTHSAFSQWLQRRLAKKAVVRIVHDQVLAHAAAVEADLTGVRICRHPMYTSFNALVRAKERSHPRPVTVVVLGALRRDKGIEDLPAVFSRLSARDRSAIRLAIVGKGQLPADTASALEALGVRVALVGGEEFADEATLVHELVHARCLLAPFRGATTSASVMTALAVGCPVVGFNVGMLEDVVPNSLLAPPRDFGQLASVLQGLVGPEPLARSAWVKVHPESWNQEARVEWRTAIDALMT